MLTDVAGIVLAIKYAFKVMQTSVLDKLSFDSKPIGQIHCLRSRQLSLIG